MAPKSLSAWPPPPHWSLMKYNLDIYWNQKLKLTLHKATFHTSVSAAGCRPGFRSELWLKTAFNVRRTQKHHISQLYISVKPWNIEIYTVYITTMKKKKSNHSLDRIITVMMMMMIYRAHTYHESTEHLYIIHINLEDKAGGGAAVMVWTSLTVLRCLNGLKRTRRWQLSLRLCLCILQTHHRSLRALGGHRGGGLTGLQANSIHKSHVSVQSPARPACPVSEYEDDIRHQENTK